MAAKELLCLVELFSNATVLCGERNVVSTCAQYFKLFWRVGYMLLEFVAAK